MKTESKIVVRYAETDQMGIVHHSVYPVWYEVARTEFIQQVGMTYTQMEQAGIMLPLMELTSRYLLPARYEDELTIQVGITKLTHVKIEFTYEVFNREGILINRGTTLHAWTNLQLRPISMKKQFPEIYRLVVQAAELKDNGKGML